MPRKSDETYFFKCFSVLFVTTLFLIGILLVIFFINEKKHRRIQLSSETVGHLTEKQRLVNDVLDSITSDLLTLAKSPDAEMTIERGVPPNNLLENLLLFSRNKKVYDQIRYLDDTGQEIVRVNYNNGEPAAVLDENLQNKAGRYYFKDAMKLGMDEIFISPFDLNVEQGKIEKPLKPMIRFGTPIFDNQGNKKGLLLLNYLGAELLGVFAQKDSEFYPSLFFLNKEGYLLKGQNSDQEWGFMYESKQDTTFASIFPGAWKQILSSEFGQFYFQGGLISFTTVYPLGGINAFSSRTDLAKPSNNKKSLLREKQYFWKIVHHIPFENFRNISQNYIVNLLWLFVTLSFVIAVISWGFATVMAKKRSSLIELMESEERFKALHEASFGGVIIHDQGIILDCNKGLSDITGFTSEELIGMNGRKLIAPDSLDEVIQNVNCDANWPYEVEGVRKDDSVYPLLIRGKNIPYKNRTARVIEFRDITERKRNEFALKESEEMFRALFEQTGGYSMILQPTFNGIPTIFDANKAACKAHGYSREEMIGRPVSDLGDEESKRLCMDKTKHILSGRALNTEAVHVRKDGSTFPVAVFANIVRFKNKPPLIVTTEFDISDRIKAEGERQLLEKQLQQAQKMEALGTLAGGVAHDFNNILSAIYGYTQLAQMTVDTPEKQKESLDGVYQAAGRAKNLVKQILTFSRKGEQEKLPLSLSSLTKEVITMLRQTVPSTIYISHEISSRGIILADPTQIHQVLMNLCTNAYHSMRQEGGTLRIRVIDKELIKAKMLWGNTVPPGKYIMVCVSDSGTGMDKNTLRKIFDPFFTTKTGGDGTGLGLAVVHGIVAGLQGYTLVDSKPGVGSTFRVYLPVSREKDAKIITGSEPISGLHGSERILFVDDEKDIQKIAERVFRKYGYQVTVFCDPSEALEHFKGASDQFDILITDMTMPKMTGLKLIHKVHEIRPHLPVVLCTGYSDLINAEGARKLGITNFVEKPFTMTNLLSITRSAMRNLEQ